MLIRHFDPFGRRVPDPMRPGRTALVTELRPSNTTALQYTDASGEVVTLEPRPDGWFTVPHDVGMALCRYRTPGGFFSDGEVDEKYRLGMITEEVRPQTVQEPPPRRRAGPDPE